MGQGISRRSVLAASAAGAAATAVPATAANPELKPLTSRSGVYTPARGDGVMQFGFDFPEPSAEVGPLLVSFRVQTYENVYAIDPARTQVLREAGHVRILCDGLLGAGGQETAPGSLTADFTIGAEDVVEWRVEAEARADIKSITTVVRGLPRGELSVSAGAF